ncbi:DUF7344 domain-containing protein [Natronorubrum aibiense]|uniref:DUF7344 domain-containing protein n=1 Tax=Natronorubrum aibiense TaxID=348826 RepID=A0A5P9P5A2_9EURY|nr:hypothetical protein [Natronorubrum aibiense]QFU83312.1 hypothetical protein GCU68_12585 [Natronorubrum aibiense]
MSPQSTLPPRSSTGSSRAPTAEESPALSQDEIFHILQTNRRRDTIQYLLDIDDETVRMREIAEHVAAREHNTTVRELTSAQRQRVYIPLYQSHLPKLDKKGVIEYNKSRGIVRATDRLEIFQPHLEPYRDESPQDDADRSLVAYLFSDYYTTAIAASTSLLVASMLGVLALSGVMLGTIITILFVLATIGTNRGFSFSGTGTAD